MHLYRICWTAVAGLLTAVGVVEAVVAVPTGAAITVALLTGATVAVVAEMTAHTRDQPPGPMATPLAAAAGIWAGAALTGLVALISGSALLLAALVVLTAPPVLTRLVAAARRGAADLRAVPPGRETEPYRPRLQPRAIPPAPPVPPATEVPAAAAPVPAVPAPDPVPVGSLTDAELCWAWRRSFTVLQALQPHLDVERWIALVALRQGYLDEIERRDPAGFRRWLYTGARPASDPSRYLGATPPDRQIAHQHRPR